MIKIKGRFVIGTLLSAAFLRGPLALSQISKAGSSVSNTPAEGSTETSVLTLEDLREIQKNLQKSGYLKMDFVLTRTTGLRGSKTQRLGKAILMKPNKFKWMFETPVKEYKIFDGNFFYDLDPVSKTASKLSTSTEISDQIREIVSVVLDFEALLKTYHLVSAQRNINHTSVILAPKVSKGVKQVTVRIDEKKSVVDGIVLEMPGRTKLDYAFSNLSFAPVSAEEFQIGKDIKVKNVL